jgi:hypothetical protein
MKIQQISLFAENKPGHLTAPARLLAQQGVDIRAMYLADTEQYGIVRMIVSNAQDAVKMLESQGFVAKLTEVLAVEVPDHPGGLADILTALDLGGINIEYMYGFPYAHRGRAVLIFRFADPDVAIARLLHAGLHLLTHNELLGELKA